MPFTGPAGIMRAFKCWLSWECNVIKQTTHDKTLASARGQELQSLWMLIAHARRSAAVWALWIFWQFKFERISSDSGGICHCGCRWCGDRCVGVKDLGVSLTTHHFMFRSYYQAKFNPSRTIDDFQLDKTEKLSRAIHLKIYISLFRWTFIGHVPWPLRGRPDMA